MGGDCRDTGNGKTNTESCPAPVTFADAHDPKKKPKPVEAPVVLAQSGTPPGQVSGIPGYGQVAPIATKTVPNEAIKRENEDHHAGGPDLPESGTTVADQRRAAQGAAAKRRGDQTRLANQRELVREPEGFLDATVTGLGVPVATESIRRGWNYRQALNTPEYKALVAPFNDLNTEIAADRRALARAGRGTAEYTRLEGRLAAYDKLRLGQPKTANGLIVAEAEMGRLETDAAAGRATGFTPTEIAALKNMQTRERLLLAQRGEATSNLRGDWWGGAGRLSRGIAGAAGTYWFDSTLSSNLATGGHENASEFFAPNRLTTASMAATWTAPVPGFMPGAGGNWWQRLGARALWEGSWYLGTHGLAFGYDKVTDPDVERRHLTDAKAAQTEDHTKKTPDSMNAAIEGWKKLGLHNNQIQQALEDTLTQIGTNDPAKLAETRRDLVAEYAAYAELRLESGTRVGGPDSQGKPLPGTPQGQEHYLLAGHNYDFGGMAMYNLNTARNLMNELGIPANDPVAKQVYSSLSESYMSRIMNPHSDLPKVYDELKDHVKKNDPDAQWLSAWIPTRVDDQKKLMAAEESAAMAAKRDGRPFTPQYNNYVLAKVYQDQALLEMAYADTGNGDKAAHLRAAHDALKEAARIGWTGREIKVNGVAQTRQGDLTQLITMYKGLGGTVDW